MKRRVAIVGLLFAAACANEVPASSGGRARASLGGEIPVQSAPTFPAANGRGFGQHLATCPDKSWVASANTGWLYSSRGGGQWWQESSVEALTVGCAPDLHMPVLGSNSGLWSPAQMPGALQARWPGNVSAIASCTGRPLVVSNGQNGFINFVTPDLINGVSWTGPQPFKPGGALGHASTWLPGCAAIAISGPGAGEAIVVSLTFSLLDNSVGTTPGAPMAPPAPGAGPTFGSTLAAGFFLPDAGVQLVVGEPGLNAVHAFDPTTAAHLGTLLGDGGTTSRFGAALAVEHLGLAQPLDALWVGEPGRDRVHRLLGSASTTWVGPAGTGFGSAIAVLPDRQVLVGAPDAGGQLPSASGGVYVLSTPPLTGDTAATCTVGLPCTRANGCANGTCVGGVLCVDDDVPTSCPQGDVCLGAHCYGPTPADAGTPPVDAGAPGADAGTLDAGTAEPDGGRRDGGAPDGADGGFPTDAGTPPPSEDAAPPGPAVFTTSGCASAGTLPAWSALCLALARRRRRR